MKYYFELELKNKETNGTKCHTFNAFGSTLEEARKDLLNDLEECAEYFDTTSYSEKLEEEFVKINNINAEQLEVLTYYFENEKEEVFDFWTICNNLDFISKVLNKKPKDIALETQLEIAIDEIAPGYYHDLKVIRHY